MKLKAVLTSLDDVAEEIKQFYVEKDGKFELQVDGMKTSEDVSRVQEALRKERAEHKETKTKLAEWGDMDPEETRVALEKIPELEAGVGDSRKKKTDEQVEAIVRGRTGVLERQIEKLTAAAVEKDEALTKYRQADITRKLLDAARQMAIESKALPDTFKSDKSGFMVAAVGALEVNAEGEIVTREGGGLTAGLSHMEALQEFQELHPYFWPTSSGGGANPGGGVSGPNVFKSNDMTARALLARKNPAEFKRQFEASGLPHEGAKIKEG